MDLNHRCLGVGQESLPLDHGTVLSFCMCKAEAVGLEPTIPIHRDTCFRDRLLIRPDDFPAAGGSFFAELPRNFVSGNALNRSRVAGAGIEPAAS